MENTREDLCWLAFKKSKKLEKNTREVDLPSFPGVRSGFGFLPRKQIHIPTKSMPATRIATTIAMAVLIFLLFPNPEIIVS
jgi:hypothetical protein